jgi:hypothetical protein
MEASYLAFTNFVKAKGATIYDNTSVLEYRSTLLWETFSIKRAVAAQPLTI